MHAMCASVSNLSHYKYSVLQSAMTVTTLTEICAHRQKSRSPGGVTCMSLLCLSVRLGSPAHAAVGRFFCTSLPLQQSITCAHEDAAVAFLFGQL